MSGDEILFFAWLAMWLPQSIDLRGCRYHRTVRAGNGALGERALPEEATP